MKFLVPILMAVLALPAASQTAAPVQEPIVEMIQPAPRSDAVPRAAWDNRRQGRLWTRTTLTAIRGHGSALLDTVPVDIADWCPAYRDHGPKERAAFWNALISTVVKHESTYRPGAVGGDGKWYGLMQILPSTAQGHECRASTGQELKHGPSNLSCAVRIMAEVVARDGAIALKDGERAGLATQWGPMTDAGKLAEMSGYTRKRKFCRSLGGVRPKPRPDRLPQITRDD